MKMKLVTGNWATQLSSLFLMVVALLMAVAPFIGLSPSEQFGLLHGGLLLTLGLLLVVEAGFEGQRTSVDAWSLMDWVGIFVGGVVGLTGLSTLLGVAFGFTFLALPNTIQSVVFISLAVLLGRELFTA